MSDSPSSQGLPLIVGVSTRALFQLEKEHAVFVNDGVEAYARLQLSNENVVLEPGAAFEVIRRLLALNAGRAERLVEVILLSRNSPDLSLRAFNSAEKHGLSIERGSFTSGRSVAPFVSAWGIDLFLSNEDADVLSAITAGAAAAKLVEFAHPRNQEPHDEVRIALDCDSVIFDKASDMVYASQGLEAFLAHEAAKALVPMDRGPFGNFLVKLALVREAVARGDGTSRVRIALVTARNAPAHKRVVHTLRAWGAPADEAHFVGKYDKTAFLAAFGAHMFFDDQEKHVQRAAAVVPAGHVPGPHNPLTLIQPAAE